MQFRNGDIRHLSGSPRKGKSKKRDSGSLKGILQENGENVKSTWVQGMPITQRILGFDGNGGSDTGNCTGGYVGGSMSAAEDDGEYFTPILESLLQLEGTSYILIISWFGDFYMIDSTTLFVKGMVTEMPQIFATRPVIDSAATICSDLKT